jgi:hypothetical protein
VSGAKLGSILEAGQPDVEIPALDGLLDRSPRDLQEARLSPETGGDHSRDLDVEAAHFGRISGVGLDERRAAFGVATPAQLRGRARGGYRRRLTRTQCEDRREKWCPHG